MSVLLILGSVSYVLMAWLVWTYALTPLLALIEESLWQAAEAHGSRTAAGVVPAVAAMGSQASRARVAARRPVSLRRRQLMALAAVFRGVA